MPQFVQIIVVLSFLFQALGYRVLIDLNTYTAAELLHVPNIAHDGIYVIHVNSPNVSDAQWAAAIQGGGLPSVSEDNPMQFNECRWSGKVFGGPTYALGYHEDAIAYSPTKTLLNWGEIDQYKNNCNGHSVLALTRAYWPGSDWETYCKQVLSHPYLGGIAMEYNPNETGLRSEDHFVNELLNKYGKKPFFLWPLIYNSKTTEQNIRDSINWLWNHGVNLNDDRIHIVIARYDNPHIPVVGASNTVQSAINAAMTMKMEIKLRGDPVKSEQTLSEPKVTESNIKLYQRPKSL